MQNKLEKVDKILQCGKNAGSRRRICVAGHSEDTMFQRK